MKLTEDEIESGKSAKGGFTRKQLARWGVPWPPPKGWKAALMAGDDPVEKITDPSPIVPIVSAHNLLRNVVLAVIENGHARDLYEFPEVLAYFGAQIPSDPSAHHRVVSDTGFDDAEAAE